MRHKAALGARPTAERRRESQSRLARRLAPTPAWLRACLGQSTTSPAALDARPAQRSPQRPRARSEPQRGRQPRWFTRPSRPSLGSGGGQPYAEAASKYSLRCRSRGRVRSAYPAFVGPPPAASGAGTFRLAWAAKTATRGAVTNVACLAGIWICGAYPPASRRGRCVCAVDRANSGGRP